LTGPDHSSTVRTARTLFLKRTTYGTRTVFYGILSHLSYANRTLYKII